VVSDTSSADRRGLSEQLRSFVEEMPYERRSILAFVRGVADRLPVGTVIVDVGAGDAPYRELFEHCRYIATDWQGSVHEHALEVDVVAPADELPLADASADAVLCTQMLEHVPDPRAVLGEIARILHPGGRAFITVPFVWELHELPHDYWRFTPASLARLMEDAGFRDIDVNSRTDCFTSLAQLMHNLGNAMGRAPDGRDPEREEAARLLRTLADRLVGLAALDVNRIFPLGFTVSARRDQ
jgi:SAM-dependent methyltransferase